MSTARLIAAARVEVRIRIRLPFPHGSDARQRGGGGGGGGGGGEDAVLARIFPRLPDRRRAPSSGQETTPQYLAAPDGRVVITTDTMVHGPDFRLAWSTPSDLGWKAAATNLSDIAAMGAWPTALVVALVAPRRPRSRCSRASRMGCARHAMRSRPAVASSAATSSVSETPHDRCHRLRRSPGPGCGAAVGLRTPATSWPWPVPSASPPRDWRCCSGLSDGAPVPPGELRGHPAIQAPAATASADRSRRSCGDRRCDRDARR